jgi:class 3 adenylate cyclase/tetratricopeptide (TPR) repeat protein
MICAVCRDHNPYGAVRCIGCGSLLEQGPEERKFVTVLFADVSGSLRLIRGRDPEEAREMLDPIVSLMVEKVRAQGGTVAQTLGDGIMAFFGAPFGLEDHAARACHAALDIRDGAAEIGRETLKRSGYAVTVRVGLHSGEVLFTGARQAAFLEFAAVGETVHIAARMQQIATPGTVRASRATILLAEGAALARALGPMRIKGIPAPMQVFELAARLPRRPRFHAAAKARGLTIFINRKTQLAALRRAVRDAGDGRGQVVGLVGEPGCGKSRLTFEAANIAREAGFTVLEAAGIVDRHDEGYLPIKALCRGLIGALEDDDEATVQARMDQYLVMFSADGKEHELPDVQPVLALLDARAAADPGWRALDPENRRTRTITALRTLLAAQCRSRPLMLVVEDLQWADAETLSVLDQFVPDIAGLPLLLVVNYRPEVTFRWQGIDHGAELQVNPLQPEDARLLTGALLGSIAGRSRIASAVTERAGGNPFFTEEIVEALAEEGVLRDGTAGDRPGATLHELALPATVRTLLAARMDRLAPADKRLLEAAAVLGKDFSEPLLADLLDVDQLTVSEALQRLSQSRFFHPDGPVEAQRHSFWHPLTYEVAYNTISLARRRTMHGRAVEAIEQRYADRLADHAEALARHAALARQWDRVIVYARLAGQKAVVRSANLQAVAFFEEVLKAISALPETPALIRLGLDVRFELRFPLFRLGRIPQVLERLREAAPLAERLDDGHSHGQLAIFLGHAMWLAGDTTGSRTIAERAIMRARAVEDRALEIRLGLQIGLNHFASGDYAGAIAAMQEVSAAIRGEPQHHGRYGLDTAVHSLAQSYAARALAEIGEIEAASEAAAESARLAEEWDKPFSYIFSEVALAQVALGRGTLNQALSHSERAREFCNTAEGRLMAPVALSLLGAARLRIGLPAEQAIEVLEEAVQLAEAMGFLFGHPQRLVLLAEAKLVRGEASDASRIAAKARQLATRLNDRGGLAHSTRLLGLAGAASGRATALRHLRRAAEDAAALGMRPLEIRCRSELTQERKGRLAG